MKEYYKYTKIAQKTIRKIMKLLEIVKPIKKKRQKYLFFNSGTERADFIFLCIHKIKQLKYLWMI